MNRRKDFSNRFNSRPRWFDLRAREGAIERSRFLRLPSRVFRRFRGSLYSSLHNNRGVHASVIYVISEVFFGSIRLERRARTRVPATPGLKPCNRFNVKQYTGQLYAIRLCARDKPPTLFLFANRLSRGARARTRADFRENGHAIGSFRATSSIPSVVSRSSSYGDSALMLDSYSEDRENFIFTRSRNWGMKNVKKNL